MKYPSNINGPKFNDGDLVSFIFDGAELALKALKIPRNNFGADRLCSINDFRSINTRNWDTNDQERPCIELLLQRWRFEDAQTLDNIAECEVFAGLVEVNANEREANALLSYPDFENLMLAWHHYSVGDEHNEKYELDPTWPALPNRYNGRAIEKEHLDWFIVELKITLQEKPVQLAMIPINDRFVLMTFIDLQSLHYAGRSNPYSEATLKQFEKDLFDDFLSHIKIEYSSELIETIQSLKIGTPA